MSDYRQCGRRRRCGVPDIYFNNFCSENPHNAQLAWVTCQFSPDISSEHLLVVGDQVGQFFIVDVRYSNTNSDHNFIRKSIRADDSCVLELEFVPNRPSQVISLSGHSHVRLWDFERGTSVYDFKGHEGSVRALSVSPFSSNVFVTGSRDGIICQWDQRVDPNAAGLRFPANIIDNAHAYSSSQRTHGRQRPRSLSKNPTSVGITSLVYVDENTVASSSASFKTGIRLWDMRYRHKNSPMRVLEIPRTKNDRDFGVASLCVDRHGSSLFTACTDSNVYEYAINSSRKLPISALVGLPKLDFYAFDVRLTASPVSDHLLVGSGDDCGLIWDLQEQTRSLSFEQNSPAKYLPYPKFTLGGHRAEVRILRVSSSGNYIVSMDDTQWRLWESNAALAQASPLSVGFERIEYFQLPKSVLDAYRMTQLSVESDTSLRKSLKRKLTSPFVSPSKPVVRTEKFSPMTKMLKRLGSPLSPITNTLNDPISGFARRRLDFEAEKVDAEVISGKIMSKNFFHSKYPTVDLPDFVKEREMFKLKENYEPLVDMVKAKRRGSKGNLEDFVTLGKPLSNCSKMMKALERKIERSPRKLVLKRQLQESGKIAAARYTPKTPHQEKRGGSKSSADVDETPTSGRPESAKHKRRSGRTLKDYFN